MLPSTKYLFLIFGSLFFCIKTYGQVNIIGTIYENDSITTLPFAYVVNKNTGKGLMTDLAGQFKLTCKTTDTILFSYTGKLPLKFCASTLIEISNKHKGNVKIILQSKSIQLKELVIRSYSFSKEEKKYFERILNEPEPGISSPISALYYQFGKEGRQRQKLRAYYNAMLSDELARQRLSNELIRKITGNEKLDYETIRRYCFISDYFIITANEYDLYTAVKQCAKEKEREARGKRDW